MIVRLFLALFFLTPLVFTSINSELFELPKMYLVYGLTSLIVFFHLLGASQKKHPLFIKSPLFFTFLVLFFGLSLSTFFSIDLHTSLWGYYSRLNGGLISYFVYFLLFTILSVHLTSRFRDQIITASLASGFLVASFGILEHFGIDKHLWVQDVQTRVFSTFGQPNWLAAYLCILLPFALNRFLSAKSKLLITVYGSLSTLFYLCLLYTKSKSGVIAALISLGFYFIFNLIKKNKITLLITIYSLLITLSILISNPIKDKFFPPHPQIPDSKSQVLNITPSDDIRQIVWQGALKLYTRYPLVGTGPETFAYSYYWVRPASHNLTSEWEFLYNKAHNEYLNYLATTGLVGTVPYLIFIVLALWLTFPSPAIFAAFISILITNFAGFSVVVVSLYFFLLPLLALSSTPRLPSKPTKLKLLPLFILLIALFFVLKTFLFQYIADILYTDSLQHPSLPLIQSALYYRPHEPTYLSQLSLIAAKAGDINLALQASDQAQIISPFSLNLYKERTQMFFYLSSFNPKYYPETINTLATAIKFAPTDAKLYYLIGDFFLKANEPNQAIPYFDQAVALKPNYDHAYFALGQIYFSQKNYSTARKNLEATLQFAPQNEEAQEMLRKIMLKK